MGCTVRKKGNDWYLYMRQHGKCVAQKCADEEHARDTQKAVLKEIAVGRFDIAALKKKREEPQMEAKPKAQTLAQFFDKTMSPFWEGSLAAGTFSRYEL